MPNTAKLPFAHLPGLPSRDDDEVAELMEPVGRLSRAEVEEIVRSLYRAALGHRRTGDPSYLTCLAEDALVTMRLRRDPECDRAIRNAPTKPGDPKDAVDVEEMLARRGL